MTIPRQLPLIVSSVALAVAVYATVSQRERPSAKSEASAESSRRFDDMQAQVATIAARLEQLEKRLAAANAAPGRSSVVGTSDSAQEEVRVYDSAARLRLGDGIVVSSPTGVMVSDRAQKTIVGDLTIETAAATIQASDAVMEATGGSMHVKAEALSFAPRKSEREK